jgi:hypothetical protein
VILDLLGAGEVTLTSVRLLGRHLTSENHQAVLARAKRRSRGQIEALVAELAPQPDVPSSVRKLPTFMALPPSSAPPALALADVPSEPKLAIAPPPALLPRAPRPIVQTTAPERYCVQFTMGPATHEKFRRLQALLCREIPDGDPGKIFDRAVTVLLEKVEKAKLGVADRPRPSPSIRSRTDNPPGGRLPSRDVPRAVT